MVSVRVEAIGQIWNEAFHGKKASSLIVLFKCYNFPLDLAL